MSDATMAAVRKAIYVAVDAVRAHSHDGRAMPLADALYLELDDAKPQQLRRQLDAATNLVDGSLDETDDAVDDLLEILDELPWLLRKRAEVRRLEREIEERLAAWMAAQRPEGGAT